MNEWEELESIDKTPLNLLDYGNAPKICEQTYQNDKIVHSNIYISRMYNDEIIHQNFIIDIIYNHNSNSKILENDIMPNTICIDEQLPIDDYTEYPIIDALNKEGEERYKEIVRKLMYIDHRNDFWFKIIIRWFYMLVYQALCYYRWILTWKIPSVTINGYTFLQNTPSIYSILYLYRTLTPSQYIYIGTPLSILYIIRRVIFLKSPLNTKFYFNYLHKFTGKILIKNGINPGLIGILDKIALELAKFFKWL